MAKWQSAIGRAPRLEPDADISELRQRYSAIFQRYAPPPADAKFQEAQLGPAKGEWVSVDRSSASRVILYFHGGGFIAGSPQTHRGLVARLCDHGFARAFSVAYRLAPEYLFPAGLRDCVDAYRALLQKGIEPSAIVLAGDDAGGGLAFAALLAIRNGNMPMPAACLAMSPWIDLTHSGGSITANARNDQTLSWDLLFLTARQYLKKQSPADPYASPLYAAFRDFPPLMVHGGSQEILKDDASRIGDKAAEADVPVSVEIYDGMQHVFQAYPDVQEAKVSLQRLGQFIRQRSGRVHASAAQ
ncbi:MAG: alpha/beta hydrolase [Alphaproteobacteria bacterium]|nr:alpha/beta hydrolase [Alphaproteobacteria bacterium]